MTTIKQSTPYRSYYSGPTSFLRLPYSQNLTNVDIAIFGIPSDLSVNNRPGARFAPRAIREQSVFVGGNENGVWPWGYNIKNVCQMIDYGDIMFSPGYIDRMLTETEEQVTHIIAENVKPLMIGGDHSVSYPVIKAIAKKYGKISLIHFDAHSDTWESEDFNHGTMFYHAIQEGIIDPKHSIQLGIRTENPNTHGFNIFHANTINSLKSETIGKAIRKIVGKRPCYITFDIDCLDPAFAPGTGTPVLGGITSMQARNLLQECRGLNIIGADQVEVSPVYDSPGQITALAGATIAIDLCYLLHEANTKTT